MLKLYSVSTFALLMAVLPGCSDHKTLTIEPISREFNERFITGERLDTNYFSTKDVMQYYQVADFNDVPPEELLTKLSDYINLHYQFGRMDTVNKLTILFYRKRMFVDYSDHLYESARDNENRTLEGYSDDLVARIEYERLENDPQRAVFRRSLPDSKDGKRPFGQTDTIVLNKLTDKGRL